MVEYGNNGLFNLSCVEVQSLLDKIPDLLVRGEKGMQFFLYDYSEQLKYAVDYVRAITKRKKSDTLNSFRLDHRDFENVASRALNSLSGLEKEELGKEYFLFALSLFDTEKTSGRSLSELFKPLKEANLVSSLSLTIQECINNKFPYLYSNSSTHEPDQTVDNLVNLVSYLDLVEETKDSAKNYFRNRLKCLKFPNSTDHSHSNRYILFKIDQTYKLFEGGLTDLDLETFLSYSNKDLLRKSCPEQEQEKIMEKAWEVAQRFWGNIDENQFVNLINNEKFQLKYKDNKTAKLIAQSIAIKALKDEKIEKAKELIETYNLFERDRIVSSGIVANLKNGKYQFAEKIAESFDYHISMEDYLEARVTLEQKIEYIASGRKHEFDSNSMVRDLVVAGLRLKAFDEYRFEGISLARVPKVGFSKDYFGEVVLLDFQGSVFLRPGEDHYLALSNFQKEVDLRGFYGKAYIKETAYIDLLDDKTRLIYSYKSSDDNLKVAQRLVQDVFPEQNIVLRE